MNSYGERPDVAGRGWVWLGRARTGEDGRDKGASAHPHLSAPPRCCRAGQCAAWLAKAGLAAVGIAEPRALRHNSGFVCRATLQPAGHCLVRPGLVPVWIAKGAKAHPFSSCGGTPSYGLVGPATACDGPAIRGRFSAIATSIGHGRPSLAWPRLATALFGSARPSTGTQVQ